MKQLKFWDQVYRMEAPILIAPPTLCQMYLQAVMSNCTPHPRTLSPLYRIHQLLHPIDHPHPINPISPHPWQSYVYSFGDFHGHVHLVLLISIRQKKMKNCNVESTIFLQVRIMRKKPVRTRMQFLTLNTVLHWKTWKSGKNEKSFSSQGKVTEYKNFTRKSGKSQEFYVSQGKIYKKIRNIFDMKIIKNSCFCTNFSSMQFLA